MKRLGILSLLVGCFFLVGCGKSYTEDCKNLVSRDNYPYYKINFVDIEEKSQKIKDGSDYTIKGNKVYKTKNGKEIYIKGSVEVMDYPERLLYNQEDGEITTKYFACYKGGDDMELYYKQDSEDILDPYNLIKLIMRGM